MKINFKLNLFWKEVLLFASTLAVGVFSAYQYQVNGLDLQAPDIKFTWNDLAVILFLVLFFIFSNKYAKFSRFTFRLFLLLIVFAGSQIVWAAVLVPPFDILAAFLTLLAFILFRNVLTHNVGMVLAIAGIGSVVGLAISPKTAVIVLVIFSFYDIVAVYVTKHMVRMAKSMIESGAIFGLIIPSRFSDFFQNRAKAQERMGNQFMILGSGDIGLPLILAASVAGVSLPQAVIVSIFSLGGLFITHLIFINQKERKAMAALPPIATMSIIGYLITLIR